MPDTRVTFVVPTFNNRHIVGACLDSILAQTYTNFACIVVDDASTDGTSDFIARIYPWVNLTRKTFNGGPSLNRNDAVQQSASEYLAFLDSDVRLRPDWLMQTIAVLDSSPDVGIVGSKLLLALRPDLINAFGGTIGSLGIAWNLHEWEQAFSVQCSQRALWISSAAMLMRRSLFEQLGGFDETFFYGCEDSDLGWRANLAGYKTICVPEAVAWHQISETILKRSGSMARQYYKNLIRSMIKNWGAARLPFRLGIYLAYSILDIAFRSQKNAKFHAWLWNLKRLPDTLRLRRVIQRSRVVTDRELLPLFSSRFFPPVRLKDRRLYSASPAGGPSAEGSDV